MKATLNCCPAGRLARSEAGAERVKVSGPRPGTLNAVWREPDGGRGSVAEVGIEVVDADAAVVVVVTVVVEDEVDEVVERVVCVADVVEVVLVVVVVVVLEDESPDEAPPDELVLSGVGLPMVGTVWPRAVPQAPPSRVRARSARMSAAHQGMVRRREGVGDGSDGML